MKGIKAIFFDLDGTLHDFKLASGEAMTCVFSKILSNYNIDEAELKTRYYELLKIAEENAFLDGRSSTDYRTERFQLLLESFQVRDKALVKELVIIYGDELSKRMKVFPNAHLILDKLAKRYELFIVTEGPSDAQHHAIKLLGLKPYFKKVFISGEVKKMKIDGDLFTYAIKQSGYLTHEIVMVGDSYARDIVGGLQAGLNMIWLNNGETTKSGKYLEIRDMAELEKVF